MNPKINPTNLSATEIAKAINMRLWYWPRTALPYKVHARLPGKPYHLQSEHATEAEALAALLAQAERGQQ